MGLSIATKGSIIRSIQVEIKNIEIEMPIDFEIAPQITIDIDQVGVITF